MWGEVCRVVFTLFELRLKSTIGLHVVNGSVIKYRMLFVRESVIKYHMLFVRESVIKYHMLFVWECSINAVLNR